MNAEASTHVSEEKKKLVHDLADLMKANKTVMVASIKSLPSAQYQDIKKKLRGKAAVKVIKKSLIDFALEHSGNKELEKLVPHIGADFAMLFSNTDAFELSGILASEKSPAKAKAGQIAPFDIEVKAGPTELLPGPDISALSAVGLQPKVENGKIAIQADKVIVKEGDEIKEEHASIMAKLDIVPFKIGLEPVAAFSEGQVYTDIKIDKEGFITDMQDLYSRIVPFMVSLNYPTADSISSILGKAAAHEGVITRIVTGEPEPIAAEEAAPAEEVKEEPKEEAAMSTAGLASLF